MVNGIVNVYKEKGFTSFDVVAKMRGIFHQKKIGHTGTLDPDAEGVLPVCLGKATRVCDLLTDKDKVYEAVLLLGQATDTQDITGAVLHQAEVDKSEAEIRKVMEQFVGEQEQVPPMYSALKVNGKKLYELARQKLCDLARKGIEVERKSRKITVFSIDILKMNLPEVTIRVHCSKGTYIRTLCNDIGEALGCYGCMKSLLRTKVDRFTLDQALTLGEIEQLVQSEQLDFVASVDSVFLKYPKGIAKETSQKLLYNGNRIPAQMVDLMKEQESGESLEDEEAKIRMYDWNNRFIGIYRLTGQQDWKPVKLFIE